MVQVIPGTADLGQVARQGRLQHLHQKLPRQLLHPAVLGTHIADFDCIKYVLAQEARSLLILCHLPIARFFALCSCIRMSELVHAAGKESCSMPWVVYIMWCMS